MTITSAREAAEWLRTRMIQAIKTGIWSEDPLELRGTVDQALAVLTEQNVEGEERMTFTPVAPPTAPLLISFPDLDGYEVAFDPNLVIGVRSALNSKCRFSIVTVQAAPGGTTTVYQVLEGSALVIDRVNLARRGVLSRVDRAVAERRAEREGEVA